MNHRDHLQALEAKRKTIDEFLAEDDDDSLDRLIEEACQSREREAPTYQRDGREYQ